MFVALSNTLFAQAGVHGENLTTASAFMAFLQLLFSTIALQQLNRWPRKIMMGGGTILMGFSLLPAVLAGIGHSDAIRQRASVFSTLAFASTYGLTFGPGLLVYLNELFPSEIKVSRLPWFLLSYCIIIKKFY